MVRSDEQIFAERQAQYIQVFSAIAEGAGESHKHFAVLQVVRIHKHHTIHRIHFVQVIYKVALAQVHGELRMSRVTGKIGEDGGKPPEPSKMAALSWGPPGWVITGVRGFPLVLLESESGSFQTQ